MGSITDKEKQLISYLLKLASERYTSFGCNDVSKEAFLGWSDEERAALGKKMHLDNDPENHDNIDLKDQEELISATNYDWWLMSYFAEKIKTI